MDTYIALFRGINVGGKNIVPMIELVEVLEGLGLSHVKTYIQSGNVVFQCEKPTSAELSQTICTAIEKRFGFVTQVFILSINELKNAIASNPFSSAEVEPNTLHLFFLLSSPENPDLKTLERIKKESEQFKQIGKVFYLYAPEGVGRSKLAIAVEKKLGVAATARNWRTVCKIMEMATSLDAH